MAETSIMLKGTSDGILLRPRSLAWNAVLDALERSLLDAEDFFRGGRLILDLGAREFTQDQLISIRALLARYDIELWAVLSDNEKTVHLARSNGILTRIPKESEPHRPPTEPVPPEQQGVLVRQTLRSGQRVHFPGHVTLIGDVNPGAEIIAGGNIIVWGAVRGVVHAGAYGDEHMVVCALDLQPSQIRIAGYIGRPPDQRRRPVGAEIARVEDGRIVAETWSRKG
jgi:septum site-determining protein MinC